jgi:hypothetical protein
MEAAMRVFIQYDETGKIRGTLATTLEDIEVKPSSGMNVHVFDRDALNEEELRRYLGDLHSNCTVQTTAAGEATLVQKEAADRGRRR